MKPPAQVRFEPSGKVVPAHHGEMLYAAARRAGLPVGRACGLEGICGACGLRILQGQDHLSEETDREQDVKRANRVDPALRLSCVARVRGDMTVTADYW
ncbi:MAG: 2Fe-2S iron-sulfur cluster-binding protein [Myxococcota bacterium]